MPGPILPFTGQKTKAQGGQMTSPGPCLLTPVLTPSLLSLVFEWLLTTEDAASERTERQRAPSQDASQLVPQV